ncbi:hypothetical protein CO2235_U850028 [Cupriavidus oxalaticus]|uniref:Uncharacterized protein n=1 Tax=Cupriavidus oxalaticus TaxID=96344 RepID=A0A375FRL6_9BURK|nr:hypothetical protein CO2235_U850028 [Cupriavidus oxalaticus]
MALHNTHILIQSTPGVDFYSLLIPNA